LIFKYSKFFRFNDKKDAENVATNYLVLCSESSGLYKIPRAIGRKLLAALWQMSSMHQQPPGKIPDHLAIFFRNFLIHLGAFATGLTLASCLFLEGIEYSLELLPEGIKNHLL
jgi:hypothetical protein